MSILCFVFTAKDSVLLSGNIPEVWTGTPFFFYRHSIRISYTSSWVNWRGPLGKRLVLSATCRSSSGVIYVLEYSWLSFVGRPHS